MKHIKNVLIIFAVTSLLFGLIQVTSAQPGYGRGEYRQGFQARSYGLQQAERHMWIPDLTEEQKSHIKELRTGHMKEIQPIKNELKINKARMDALMTEENPNLDKINKLIEESGSMQIQLRKESAAFKLEVRKLLTDEQKVFLDTHQGRPRRDFHGRNFRHRL